MGARCGRCWPAACEGPGTIGAGEYGVLRYLRNGGSFAHPRFGLTATSVGSAHCLFQPRSRRDRLE